MAHVFEYGINAGQCAEATNFTITDDGRFFDCHDQEFEAIVRIFFSKKGGGYAYSGVRDDSRN
jgi:hypothetical protein